MEYGGIVKISGPLAVALILSLIAGSVPPPVLANNSHPNLSPDSNPDGPLPSHGSDQLSSISAATLTSLIHAVADKIGNFLPANQEAEPPPRTLPGIGENPTERRFDGTLDIDRASGQSSQLITPQGAQMIPSEAVPPTEDVGVHASESYAAYSAACGYELYTANMGSQAEAYPDGRIHYIPWVAARDLNTGQWSYRPIPMPDQNIGYGDPTVGFAPDCSWHWAGIVFSRGEVLAVYAARSADHGATWQWSLVEPLKPTTDPDKTWTLPGKMITWSDVLTGAWEPHYSLSQDNGQTWSAS